MRDNQWRNVSSSLSSRDTRLSLIRNCTIPSVSSLSIPHNTQCISWAESGKSTMAGLKPRSLILKRRGHQYYVQYQVDYMRMYLHTPCSLAHTQPSTLQDGTPYASRGRFSGLPDVVIRHELETLLHRVSASRMSHTRCRDRRRVMLLSISGLCQRLGELACNHSVTSAIYRGKWAWAFLRR